MYTVGTGETPGKAFSAARMRKDILEHLAETGRFAERLRRHGAAVDLSVGCGFWLFVPGIVPGADVLERVRNLLDGRVDPVAMQRRQDRFTAKAAAVGRSVFHGRLSYAAAQDDEVDWRLFDIVGIDHYSYLPHKADCVRELSRHLRWGKPLAVTEFGTCAYVGAPETAGMGWDIVDHDKAPPEIKGDPVRSERTQATYLMQLLDAFSSMDLYAAMAFQFVTPDAPNRPGGPRHDLDMASYALTKTIKDRPTTPPPAGTGNRRRPSTPCPTATATGPPEAATATPPTDPATAFPATTTGPR
ncbi:hypothetical protein M878_03455 [Streptomyces roseochromogenus subsp. oscitans DS 12.976]|uniref:Abortive infection protein n=1 Tax=Streptomyces roseochromogenus subsp. oscitans DS 12.976 TaxID=1352936 RepID=V6KVI6_STRRC|nr:hypothetical protein M878_03455 [Streptomyces roseochromogenus subsp. oscitans DS 12.976]